MEEIKRIYPAYILNHTNYRNLLGGTTNNKENPRSGKLVSESGFESDTYRIYVQSVMSVITDSVKSNENYIIDCSLAVRETIFNALVQAC